MGKPPRAGGTRGTFRIVAGEWRGRRFAFPPVPGVRPTPDRVRETLFNWLQNRVRGAACLDLFAGSGALGLEALSRGASRVTFVDKAPRVVDAVRDHLAVLDCDRGRADCVDARAFLAGPPTAFEIVFLDPPFGAGWLEDLLPLLASGWVAGGAAVYMEQGEDERPVALPSGWRLARSGKAGQVRYHLALVDEAESPS